MSTITKKITSDHVPMGLVDGIACTCGEKLSGTLMWTQHIVDVTEAAVLAEHHPGSTAGGPTDFEQLWHAEIADRVIAQREARRAEDRLGRAREARAIAQSELARAMTRVRGLEAQLAAGRHPWAISVEEAQQLPEKAIVRGGVETWERWADGRWHTPHADPVDELPDDSEYLLLWHPEWVA